MNAVESAMRMARIVKASNRLKTFLYRHFAREPVVKVGYAQNMEDFEADAPVFVFLPMVTKRDLEGEVASVTMYAGIVEPEERDESGFSVLTAYPRMQELLSLVFSELSQHLQGPGPTVTAEEVVVEFRQEKYPFIWVEVDIIIKEPMPSGHRRII